MPIIENENEDRRSLMNRAPCVCDGEKSGIPCKHYWPVIQKFRAANAGALRSGDKRYNCTMAPSFLLEWTSEEKPTYCGRYEPRKSPGLVALVQRAVALAVHHPIGSSYVPRGPGYEKYDKDFSTFRPMTLDEIAKNREAFPDAPVSWNFGGKSPDQLTVHDIATGPQIGMLKPGETMPGTLSDETSKAMDTLFDDTKADDPGQFDAGDGGIFKKKDNT